MIITDNVAELRKAYGKKLAEYTNETDAGKRALLYAECKSLCNAAGGDLDRDVNAASALKRAVDRLAELKKDPPHKRLAEVEAAYEKHLVDRLTTAAKGIQSGAIPSLEKAVVAVEDLAKRQRNYTAGDKLKKIIAATADIKVRWAQAVEDAKLERHAIECIDRADESKVLTATKTAFLKK
jgi:hypothetical protein